MARKVFRPISQRFGEREIFRDQESFSAGMIFDESPSEIPSNSVHLLWNSHAFPHELRGRNGSDLWSSTQYPAIEGRTGYTLSKSGDRVTGDANFTQSDVSNFIVWEDGTHDEIVEYISPSQVRVNPTGTNSGTAYLRGRINARFFHETLLKYIMHIGNELYVSTDIYMTQWVKLLCHSFDKPSNFDSVFDDDDEILILFNSNGIFRIYLDSANPYYYKINTRIPTENVNDIVREENRTYGRRYLYSAARLSGNANLRSRETVGVKIEQESGTTKINANQIDYGEVWTEFPRGDNSKLYGRLTGARVASVNRDVATIWAVLTDGSFSFQANGTRENIYVDYSGVETMDEVASRTQTALRVFFRDVTCEWITDHFVFTSGRVADTTLGYIEVSTSGGTDITGYLRCGIDEATLENDVSYERPQIVTGFELPTLSRLSDDPQWHHTHLPIYADLDIGPEGTDPVTGIANIPDRFIWLYDLRVAGAFFAEKSDTGLVTLIYGEIEPADEGSVLEWEDGDRNVITRYVDSTHFYVALVPYYDNSKTLQAAAIGNGTVLRASQSGTLVTLTNTENSNRFSASDVRKTIWWSVGYYSYITEYISPTQVRVHNSATRESQGITMNPTHRNFNDTVSDEILRGRISQWLLKQRFWEELPLSNIGVVVPGFLFAAVRGKNRISYSQLPVGQQYLGGYHNPVYQFDESAKSGITMLAEFPNRLIVFCRSQWYAGPTNESSEVTVPEVGEVVVVFNGLQFGGNYGVKDYGSYTRITKDTAMVITTEPAVREFDSYQFGENLAEIEAAGFDIIMRELESWYSATVTCYHKNLGYVAWGRVLNG